MSRTIKLDREVTIDGTDYYLDAMVNMIGIHENETMIEECWGSRVTFNRQTFRPTQAEILDIHLFMMNNESRGFDDETEDPKLLATARNLAQSLAFMEARS